METVSAGICGETLQKLIWRGRSGLTARHGAGTFITDGPPTLATGPLSFMAALHGFTKEEMFEARRVLEVGAVRLAAERATGQDLAAIAEEMAGMFASLDQPLTFLVHDITFHRAIAHASHNPILASLIEMVSAMFYEQRKANVGAVRDLSRKAAPREIETMQRRLAEGLDAGAIGFSTGLYYRNSAAADAEEVFALVRLLAEKGGVYATHMRNEHDQVLDSLEETFETAGRAGVPVVISHHKCAGPANWGRTRETLPLIDELATRQDIAMDVYPYVAGSTVLREDLVDGVIDVMVSWSAPHPEMMGRMLASIAAEWGVSQREACLRLKPGGACYFQMHEDDVRRVIAIRAA